MQQVRFGGELKFVFVRSKSLGMGDGGTYFDTLISNINVLLSASLSGCLSVCLLALST